MSESDALLAVLAGLVKERWPEVTFALAEVTFALADQFEHTYAFALRPGDRRDHLYFTFNRRSLYLQGILRRYVQPLNVTYDDQDLLVKVRDWLGLAYHTNESWKIP